MKNHSWIAVTVAGMACGDSSTGGISAPNVSGMLKAGNGYDVIVSFSADDGDSNSTANAGRVNLSVRVVNSNANPVVNVPLT